MTSPSVPRPGFEPPDPARSSGVLAAAEAVPASAVTLADLIADSGPLPADAALECVQRLAERLTLTPRISCTSLDPADVLIDDDGGVWLRQNADFLPSGADGRPHGMDRLGRLLAFLATGNDGHLIDGSACNAADLPFPLSTVAERLFSHNGTCYGSYAELANEAAVLRGIASPAQDPVEMLEPREETAAEETQPVSYAAAADETPKGKPPQESGRGLGIAMILAIAGGAVVAYLAWQTL